MKLEINNGSLGYGNKMILSEVNISIGKGEIVSVLGRNGAGKTTLFKTLLGILPTIQGDVHLNGRGCKIGAQRNMPDMWPTSRKPRHCPFHIECSM